MSKTSKWVLISIGILVVLLVILSQTGAFGKDEGLKVTAEKVQKRTITEIVNASGKIFPEDEVKVSPDISGVITELNVREGDTVKKGQLLVRIDPDVYNIQRSQAASGVAQSQAQVSSSQAQVSNSQAALEALNAQMDQAQKTYDRSKKLFDEKVISRSEMDVAESTLRSAKANYNAAVQGIRGGQANVQSAKANVQTAQASLQRANKDLSRTAITAPRDGVVSLLNVKKGESVSGNSFTVGTEILRIADMSKIEIRVDVGENDIPKVKLGDSAIVEVDAYSDRKFRGIVTQIASSNNGAAAQNALSSATGDVTQYKVYIRILAESYTDLLGKGTFPFRPGMSANADIQTKTHADVLSVPINAVTTRDVNDSTNISDKKVDESAVKPASSIIDDLEIVVFTIDKDNKVSKVKVKTDIQDINNIEITEGLKEGDLVVTGPYDVVSKTLKVGKPVKVVDKKDLFKKE
ncbi:MAG: efflux RND transporter periplasmic adaptor subunit [Chitinophagaceae bacterium]|nr:efflux RND transporter periplasmic adaptor subunit [Chitinophagaceae bacterium]